MGRGGVQLRYTSPVFVGVVVFRGGGNEKKKQRVEPC